MKYILLILTCIIPFLAFGADPETTVTMADHMRESGKIYVVVGILVTIFIGILIFLTTIERRLSKIEKSLNK